MWKQYAETLQKIKNRQAARGSGNTPVHLRPRRQTEAVANHPPDPSRRHPKKKNRPSTQGGVSCRTNPRLGLATKKGLRRRPKAYETYKAPRAEFAMPTVGVTVLPKRALAKHRTTRLQTATHRPKTEKVEVETTNNTNNTNKNERNKEEAEAPKLGRAFPPKAKERNCNQTNKPKNTEMRKTDKNCQKKKKKASLSLHIHIRTHCTPKNTQTEHAAHTEFLHSCI